MDNEQSLPTNPTESSPPPLSSEQLVREKLAPTVEVDNAGFERKIYSHNGTTFSFRGREELPLHDSLKTKRVEIVGDEPPNKTSVKEHDEYVAQFDRPSSSGTANAPHLLASKTPLGVVELAIKLGVTHPSLRLARDEIKTGVYSDFTLNLIDKIIGSSFVSDEGEVLGPHPSMDAEALVVLDQLGDPQAHVLVDEKMNKLNEYDVQRNERVAHESLEHSDLRFADVDEVTPNELMCVHATSFAPDESPDGMVTITTTCDATHGKVPTNSIHFTLNHRVMGHDRGNWDESPYILLAPYAGVQSKNGNPQLIDAVDTWWSRNPGEKLKVPSASIIALEDSQERLINVDGNRTTIKSGDYDTAEIAQFIQEVPDGDADLIKDVANTIAREIVNSKEVTGIGSGGDLIAALTDESRFKNLPKGEKYAKKLLVDYSVGRIIKRNGCTLLEAGTHSIQGNKTMQQRIAKYAANHGIEDILHANTPQSRALDKAQSAAEGANSMLEGVKVFDWKLYDPSGDHTNVYREMKDCDEKTRRNIYASGILVPRESKKKAPVTAMEFG